MDKMKIVLLLVTLVSTNGFQWTTTHFVGKALSIVVRRAGLSDTWLENRPVAARLLECSSDGSIMSDPKLSPLAEQTDDEKQQLSLLVDYLHTELLKLSPDADELDDENAETIDDAAYADFIAEGKKLLSISSSHVAHGEDADAVAHSVWTCLGSLLYDHNQEDDNGILVAMPTYLGDVKSYVNDELLKPLSLMGLGKDRIQVESYRVAQGAPFPAFRIVYSGK